MADSDSNSLSSENSNPERDEVPVTAMLENMCARIQVIARSLKDVQIMSDTVEKSIDLCVVQLRMLDKQIETIVGEERRLSVIRLHRYTMEVIDSLREQQLAIRIILKKVNEAMEEQNDLEEKQRRLMSEFRAQGKRIVRRNREPDEI